MSALLRQLRPADWLLTASLLLAGVAVTWATWNRDGGTTAVVRVEGVVVSELPLDRDQSITVEGSAGSMVIEVRDAGVYVRETACPQKRCVAMSPARRRGDLILCVPGEILITVRGGEEEGVDGVTG